MLCNLFHNFPVLLAQVRQVRQEICHYMFDQINDVFAETGAGARNNAYVTVEVLTSGCEVWAYGAVIDGTDPFPGTNDPTTIPLTILE